MTPESRSLSLIVNKTLALSNLLGIGKKEPIELSAESVEAIVLELPQ